MTTIARPRLSDVERQVLELALQGQTFAQIGTQISKSTTAVSEIAKRVYAALGATSRRDLPRAAIRAGFAEDVLADGADAETLRVLRQRLGKLTRLWIGDDRIIDCTPVELLMASVTVRLPSGRGRTYQLQAVTRVQELGPDRWEDCCG